MGTENHDNFSLRKTPIELRIIHFVVDSFCIHILVKFLGQRLKEEIGLAFAKIYLKVSHFFYPRDPNEDSYFPELSWSDIYLYPFLSGFIETWLPLSIFSLVYFTTLESLFQSTIGKAFTGSKVLNNSYEKCGTVQILRRSLIRVIPFEYVSFLFENGQWHDKWSKTIVVQKKHKFI